jgi:hypothetical protein
MRRHISYANVTATLALLLAMSGGALAANHYLLNSTRQINPKVLKALKGRRGATGKQGVVGLGGAIGPQGVEGPPGPRGARGEQGKVGAQGFSPGSPLPSGQSESGDYAVRSLTAGVAVEALTYPMHLEKPPAHFEYVAPGATSGNHCAKPGHADAGYLCIYSVVAFEAEEPSVSNFEAKEPEGGKDEGVAGPGANGFQLTWNVLAEGHDSGTYTVTAE